jgi:hypothetical protein
VRGCEVCLGAGWGGGMRVCCWGAGSKALAAVRGATRKAGGAPNTRLAPWTGAGGPSGTAPVVVPRGLLPEAAQVYDVQGADVVRLAAQVARPEAALPEPDGSSGAGGRALSGGGRVR